MIWHVDGGTLENAEPPSEGMDPIAGGHEAIPHAARPSSGKYSNS